MTDLHTGARAPGHPADSRIETALSALRAGSPDDVAAATVQLKAAADDGSAEGWRWLATLSAAGVGMPQDWERALDLLVTAAEGGNTSAQGQLRALAADAAADADGDRSDWPALRRSVRVDGWFQRGEKTVLSAAPRIVTVRGFLSAGACAWLRGRTRDGLSQALLLTGEAATDEGGYRTHSAYAFNFVDCDVVLLMTRARIAANIGVPLGSLEVSQILHYRIGETFGLHFDYLKPNVPKEAAEIATTGQRIVTFLIYLNGGFEGGETDFPRTGVRFRGEPGDALYFANVDGAGDPDPRTLHAGLPPSEGEKWLFSQGVRSLAWV